MVMDDETASELAGWVGLVHPEILAEFESVKEKDPYFLAVEPSREYYDVKAEIDGLVDASGREFTQRQFNQRYRNQVGYYYRGQLAFVYDSTCIVGGCKPHLTYWNDFTVHDNEFKEGGVTCTDCHFISNDGRHVVKRVKRILDQIAKKEG